METIVTELRGDGTPNNTIVGTTKHLLEPAKYSEHLVCENWVLC